METGQRKRGVEPKTRARTEEGTIAETKGGAFGMRTADESFESGGIQALEENPTVERRRNEKT